jgi:hypothetical protein
MTTFKHLVVTNLLVQNVRPDPKQGIKFYFELVQPDVWVDLLSADSIFLSTPAFFKDLR